VDRCQDRTVAAAVLPLRRTARTTVLDAGLAATGTRADVAATLAAAGIPRPTTMLVASEAAGLAALEAIGYPATYLPLTPGAAEIALLDRDTAEAVFEHRSTLGGSSAAMGLLQAGATYGRGRVSIVVVDGQAVAIHDPACQARYAARFVGVAEMAANALDASIVGIELLATPNGPVVWDVNPVPEFRDATPLGGVSVAEAIAELAARHIMSGATIVTQLSLDDGVGLRPGLLREVPDGVVLSA
jgi:glutathione synthase/RimK-type ligase-like ATP-grasp enzyme